MASVLKHKKARTTPESEGQDRLSKLPDELIHKIYSFLDAKEAVQASVLSKRWKLMWTTLPSIAFSRYSDCLSNLPFCNVSRFAMFIRHVLCNRNHQSSVSELKMYVPWKLTVERSVFSGCVIEKFIQYAIEREVECLNIGLGYRCEAYKLSAFSSKSLRELTLNMPLEMCEESDCWDLPALTTLHLKHNLMLCLYLEINHKITESWLTSLPALRTLQLDLWNLSETSFSLPNLTTLGLYHCALSKTVWDLPALINLHLDIGALPKNLSDIFSTLASLKNLTLILDTYIEQDHFISCPQLLNLNIRISCHPAHDTPHGKIMVRAPQLCNFSSFGIFLITFEVTELEHVDIQLKDYFRYVGCVDRKTYYQRFTCMLLGLGTAKNISFDLESIEALAKNCNLASCASPFYNLKCVKLPKEYKVSSIPGALRSYLLSGSPGATIVTSFPRKNSIPQTRAVSVAAENVVLPEPLAAPTKELGDCQYINEVVSSFTLDTGAGEPHVMENYLDDSNRATQTNPAVVGVSNDRVSSSEGNKDIGLWQGHEVNSEHVCLLNRIINKYPETFDNFTTKNKKLCTMNLNMLCTSLNDFTKMSLTEVDSEMIVEYRDAFAYLQNRGFNLTWLVSRLNYIERLKFSNPLIPELHAIDCHIDDAKSKLHDLQSKLHDLQALRMAKMSEIQNAFGTIGTSLAAGSIGDDLLSSP